MNIKINIILFINIWKIKIMYLEMFSSNGGVLNIINTLHFYTTHIYRINKWKMELFKSSIKADGEIMENRESKIIKDNMK